MAKRRSLETSPDSTLMMAATREKYVETMSISLVAWI
jgi:hypothetical protein